MVKSLGHLARKVSAVACALALTFGMVSVSSAQGVVQGDAALTQDSISVAFDSIGINVNSLMTEMLGIVGPLYLQALVTGFVFTIGWIIYGHFKRGAKAK